MLLSHPQGVDAKIKEKSSNGCAADIKESLEELLRTGFITRYGGGFLLVPYLQQIEIEKQVHQLGVSKTQGIPALKLSLAILNHAIYRGKRLFHLENYSKNDVGLAVLSGLAQLPEDSVGHDFLNSISVDHSDQFWLGCAGKFVETGLIVGKRVIFDKKFIAFWGKKKMRKDQHGTRHQNMKGIGLYITYDMDGKSCIYKREEYPGAKPTEVGISMLAQTAKITKGKLERVTFDKWFSIGSLLDYLNRTIKIKYVTVLRLCNKRIKEMENIPTEQFRQMADGREITFIETSYINYEGFIRLVVIHFKEDGKDKYYGYLTNDKEKQEESLLQEYNTRQNIENFLDELNFLNIEKLPGIDLNKISAMNSLKMVGFNILSSLRRDLKLNIEIEGIYNKVLDNVARVSTQGSRVMVKFYRHKMGEKIAPLFIDLNQKLKQKNVDPRIPWLNNRTLEFEFK